MKVLLVAADYPPPFVGGSAVYVHSLLAGFPESAEVLAGSLPSGAAEPTPSRHRALRSRWLVPSRNPSRLRLAVMYAYLPLILLARRFRTRDDAALLSLGVVGNALLIPICRLLGVRAVVLAYAEELTMPLKSWGLKNAIKRTLLTSLYPCAQGYVAVSQFTKGVLEFIGADPSRVKIIWPPINTEKIRDCGGPHIAGRRILSVGRLVRRKGFDKLIYAVDRLRSEIPDIQLWIVGDGSERQAIESLVIRLGLQAHVLIKGEVSEDELASFYRECDVFALANMVLENGDCEGSPTVLIEASAYSKPVIAGADSGADAMISHGDTGYLVNAADIEALSGRIKALLLNPELALRLGKAGRQKALTFHTASRAGARLHEFLSILLQQDDFRNL